jgi:uncharacterized radical SAM superfamily Fe-S cluster-containing enzyme
MDQLKDVKDLMDKYLVLRDEKEKIDARHKEELKPYKEAMEKLDSVFLTSLNETGLDAMSTTTTTVYKEVITTMSIADRPMFLGHVRENDAWNLADIRPAKVAIRAAMEDGETVPGVNVTQIRKVKVKRKPKKVRKL